VREEAQSRKGSQRVKKEGEGVEVAGRPSIGQALSRTIILPRSVGAWSRSGKDRNIDKITRRAGYGGVFTLTGKEHPSVVTAAKSQGEGIRKRRAARGRLAGYGTLYPMKQFTSKIVRCLSKGRR